MKASASWTRRGCLHGRATWPAWGEAWMATFTRGRNAYCPRYNTLEEKTPTPSVFFTPPTTPPPAPPRWAERNATERHYEPGIHLCCGSGLPLWLTAGEADWLFTCLGSEVRNPFFFYSGGTKTFLKRYLSTTGNDWMKTRGGAWGFESEHPGRYTSGHCATLLEGVAKLYQEDPGHANLKELISPGIAGCYIFFKMTPCMWRKLIAKMGNAGKDMATIYTPQALWTLTKSLQHTSCRRRSTHGLNK